MSDTHEIVIIKDLNENLNLWAEKYKGKPILLSLFRAVTILRELERERDKAREAIKEAWLAMDEIEGTDRMNDWQNKYATILEEVK